MTLRTRLLVTMVAVVAAGLVVAAAATYAQLRTFLLDRLSPQLEVASFSVARAVASSNGVGPAVPFATGSGPVVIGAAGTSSAPAPAPATPGATAGRWLGPKWPHGALPRPELVPTGTVGELVRTNGAVVGHTVTFTYGGQVPALPVLPRPLPVSGGRSPALFDAASRGTSPIPYRVLVRRLGSSGLAVVVAVPLTDLNQTLDRLLLIEVLVSAAVLAALGLLAWWLVRRDLRPLEAMAASAGAIAGGELGRRVAPAEERTEVGRLGLALNAMLGEIEEALDARSASEARLRRFLADASHELRTPLTSIRGYAELYERGARSRPADLDTAMRHIREEARRMNQLVDELLFLAQSGEGRQGAWGPVDLEEVVRAAVEAAQAAHPAADLRLRSELAPPVAGDPDRLRQVVDNLVANAVRYAPTGSPIEVVVAPGTDEVTVEVRDHGPGVEPAERERVFEPFYRSDFARARRDGGAGLGLAIVSAIVGAHGGEVGVRPTPGGGATFWFSVPSAPRRVVGTTTFAEVNGEI